MSVIEAIARDLRRLSLRQQVEVAGYVRNLAGPDPEQKEMLKQMYGCLSEEDGRVFEEALADSRRMPSSKVE